MSFGFSVGDFIAAIELANKIRKEFVDAPSQFKDISDEMRSLSIVLQDIEVVLSEPDLTTQQKTELREIVDGCLNVLQRLEQTLDKYGELKPGSTRIGNRVKRVWKRLKWEPEDIKELRSRIIANVTLLNIFQGTIASQISLATKGGVDRLHERYDNRERHKEFQAILDWLTPIDYAPQQNDFIAQRQEGTGQWLLDSIEFQTWLETKKQTLFCPGIPGAGKTVLTSVVIKELTTRFSNDPTIGIAYIYCNFRRQDEQKIDDLLASQLKQLAECQPSLPASVKDLYNRHKTKRTRPVLDEISRALQCVAALYSRVFIVIDALDECQVSHGCQTTFLSEMFSLQAKCGAQLFVTSRFIPKIIEKFNEGIRLDIRASNEDVQRYLDGHMSQLPGCVLRSSELQEGIKAEIIKAVDGMFLLAQLHLVLLKGKKSPKAIRNALKRLPTGSEAYDSSYNDAMERIEGQLADEEELAKQVLSWITCAKRPLTTLELEHALAIETGESQLDTENLCRVEDVVSLCAGLVTVDKESKIIRLVHYTTQEYFDRTRERWFPNAETDIATTCVTYLSFDEFKSGICQNDNEFEDRLQGNPLYDYASQNWGHHARKASTPIVEVTRFLEKNAQVEASSQALLAIKLFSPHLGYSQGFPRKMTGLHLVSYFGIDQAVKLLLSSNSPDLNDSYGQTPLSWAARRGHEAIVKQLLATDGVDPDSKDKNGQTPLSVAAKNGHDAVVKLLLDTGKIDADSKEDEHGLTPLLWAVARGHDAVVKLMLSTDKIGADSKDGRTPLLLAAASGHEAVVKLLLDTGKVDAGSIDDEHGRTPLLLAAASGHEAIVKLLLAIDGVDVDSKDEDGGTPLSWAAISGHEAIVKLLLDTGKVDADSKDEHGWTPLLLAAAGGHETIVKLLLGTGRIDAHSKDERGWTPLLLAAASGHEAVVKLLLDTGKVDTDLKGERSWTPLLVAAASGHEAVVKLLLKKGAEVGIENRGEQTAL